MKIQKILLLILKMESLEKQEPIQITTKNPKKVEAGKIMAEYNRKKREELKMMKESKPQVKQQTTSEFTSENMGYGIAVFIAIAEVCVYYLYTRPKNSPVKARNDLQPMTRISGILYYLEGCSLDVITLRCR